jgi:hypothetical protein
MLSERFHFLNAYMLVSISSFLLLGHSCVPVKCCFDVALTQFFTFFFPLLVSRKKLLRFCNHAAGQITFIVS